MKRMVDNKKLSEIEASGGTQWYTHKLMKNGMGITFVLPFEKNLFEIASEGGFYTNVFGIVLNVAGPSIGDINVKSTFPNIRFDSSRIECYTAKSDGTIATTTINITDYTEDIVNKYQVI